MTLRSAMWWSSRQGFDQVTWLPLATRVPRANSVSISCAEAPAPILTANLWGKHCYHPYSKFLLRFIYAFESQSDRQGEREKIFHSLVEFQLPATAGSKPGTRNFIWVSCMDTSGSRYLHHLAWLLLGLKQEAGVEQPTLEPVPTWDANNTVSGFSHYVQCQPHHPHSKVLRPLAGSWFERKIAWTWTDAHVG